MTGASFISSVRHAARRLMVDDRGNIAMLFGLAVLPILLFVGAAIDYSRANAARSSMQSALDSTSLMLSRDLAEGTITTSDLATKAQSYFNALYTSKEAQNPTVTVSYAPNTSTGSNIIMKASASINTDFMQLVGVPSMNFSTNATATWGNTRMRVAMVLDNTGSMGDNGKMSAMQSAAKDMVDTLSTFNKQTGDVYISIVPFAKDVNVGKSNVDAPWINWTEWEGEPPIIAGNNKPSGWSTTKAGSNCPFTSNSHGFTCMDRPATTPGAKSASKIPSNGYICPSIDNGKKRPGKTDIYYNGCYTTVTGSSASCGSNTICDCSGNGSNKICHLWRGDGTTATADAAPAHSTWTGCINDRDQNYDTTNVAPGSSSGTGSTAPSTQFYAEQWSGCLPATVFGMSNDWTTLKNQISAMSPSGNTNQAVGMAWGWQSLSTTNGPVMAPAKDSNYIYKDYVVLLSDGLNTQNRWSNNASDIDARQEILCQNVKGDTTNPVMVFTIQVNINNKDKKSQVLQDCATNGNFQMITSASQTADAFKNIITEISKLRVAY
jgi:Flp pilus assembly protein TadG